MACGEGKGSWTKDMVKSIKNQLLCSWRKWEASFKKLATISTITAPMGNAAIILTDCRLLMELSEKTRAIGSKIKMIHHISSTVLPGEVPDGNLG